MHLGFCQKQGVHTGHIKSHLRLIGSIRAERLKGINCICRKQKVGLPFTTWYSADVQQQIESGTRLEDTEVDLRMSVFKPVHYLASTERRVSFTRDGEQLESSLFFPVRNLEEIATIK